MAGAKTALLLAHEADARAHAAVLPMPQSGAMSNATDDANPWAEELAGVRSAWRATASGASNLTLRQQERAAAKEEVVRTAAAAESVRLRRLQAEADLERARTVTQVSPSPTPNPTLALTLAPTPTLTL